VRRVADYEHARPGQDVGGEGRAKELEWSADHWGFLVFDLGVAHGHAEVIISLSDISFCFYYKTGENSNATRTGKPGKTPFLEPKIGQP
jgi:hypothetical protein